MPSYNDIVKARIQHGDTLEEAQAFATASLGRVVHLPTDHRAHIEELRDWADLAEERAKDEQDNADDTLKALVLRTGADLLEMHESRGLSLDSWPAARGLVEALTGEPIKANRRMTPEEAQDLATRTLAAIPVCQSPSAHDEGCRCLDDYDTPRLDADRERVASDLEGLLGCWCEMAVEDCCDRHAARYAAGLRRTATLYDIEL